MTRKDFLKLVESRFEKVKETFLKKNGEYAEEENIFRNFIDAADKRNTTKEDALEGMAVKHTVSIDDMVKTPGIVTREMVDEKIGDRILYYLLLEGMFMEHIESAQPCKEVESVCPCGYTHIGRLVDYVAAALKP